MVYFAIIETEDGMMVVECPVGSDLAVVAEANKGVVIDPGPFDSYEHAYDALLNLAAEEDDEQDTSP